MDFRAVIMAGGTGTRFWPLSRKKKPKQFLPIVSEKTMIEETIDRLSPRVPMANIYTIANPEKTKIIKSLLPDLPDENFLIEPMGKNTAPSLVLATVQIYLQNPGAVLAALPADHLIKNPSLFLQKAQGRCEIRSFLPPMGIDSFPQVEFGPIELEVPGPSFPRRAHPDPAFDPRMCRDERL